MPIVNIDYDNKSFSDEEVKRISEAMQQIAAEATGYSDDEISIFARANHITVNAAPIEIYIYATFSDDDGPSLETKLRKVAELVTAYKTENGLTQSFNLSIVKMDWKFEIGV